MADPLQVSRQLAEMRYPKRSVRWTQRLGLLNHRNIVWSWYSPRNFGDWIGPYLYQMATGEPALHHPGRRKMFSRARALLTVGSILRRIQTPDVFSVWGSGIISQDDVFSRPYRVHSVRGPETRKRLITLGFPSSDVFGDPAILLPHFLPVREAGARHEIGLIPHYSDHKTVATRFGHIEGLKIINVSQPIHDVVDEIASCAVTLSSSLHGVIVSHAYGVPCRWIGTSKPLQGDDIKFMDYFQSLGHSSAEPPIPLERLSTLADLQAAAGTAILLEQGKLASDLWRACPCARGDLPAQREIA